MASLLDFFNVTDDGLKQFMEQNDIDLPFAAFKREIDTMVAIENASPAILGAKAPEFEAVRMSADGELTDEIFRPSSIQGEVLALMFGSYTCPVFCGKIDRQQEIYEELGDKARFVCIYTLEAHPLDGWHVESNEEAGIMIATHKSTQDRAEAAHACTLGTGLGVPMVLDSMQDEAAKLYNGSPERLFVIDRDGTIVFRSSVGPFDMEDVENWYQALVAQFN